MSILSILKKLFPFLVSAAEKTFNQLEDAAKDAGINGSLFAQIIKENSHAAVEDVRNLIKDKLGLSEAQLAFLEKDFCAEYNWPDSSTVIQLLQMKLNNATSGDLHDLSVSEIAIIAVKSLSGGVLTKLIWLMGVGEYIYRKFVNGVDVKVAETPKCPPHYVWNGSQCVPDIG